MMSASNMTGDGSCPLESSGPSPPTLNGLHKSIKQKSRAFIWTSQHILFYYWTMRPYTVALVLPLSIATGFSPRNGLETRTLLEKNEQTTSARKPSSPDISRLPATFTPSPMTVPFPDNFWNQPSNATENFSVNQRRPQPRSKRSSFFLNLPIEKDAELKTDQRILAEVLKEPVIEVTSVFLVMLSSLLVALSTVNTIDLKTIASIIRAENVIASVFAFEFFARWFSQFTWKGIVDYLLQPLVIIDLVVVILPLIPLLVPPASAGAYDILPSWFFSSSGLVNLRLLRILRLQRVLRSMESFADFQMALGIPKTETKPYQLELSRVVLSIFTLLSISTGLIYSTEHSVNPNIPSYFDALYFTLTTLTTVGFGDIVPVTPEGKLVVSGSILAGVAVIPAQAAALVEALLAREQYKTGDRSIKSTTSSKRSRDERRSMVMAPSSCSNCGAEFHWANAEFCWSCGTKLDGDSRE